MNLLNSPHPKLLIWTDCGPPGGICEFNHSIAVGMARRGYDVCLVGPGFDAKKLELEQSLGIRHVEGRLPELQLAGPSILTADETAKLLHEIAPDVVLFSDGSAISNLLAKSIAAEIGLPMIFSLGIVLEQHVGRAQAYPHFQKIFAAARRVVCVSRHNQKLLSERYPIGDVRPILVHYGRPERFFSPRDGDRRDKLRHELGVAPDEVLFFTSARYEAIKGFGLFALALKVLRDRPLWPRLKFAWAGEGSARAKLTELLVSERLIDRVKLLGERQDIAELLEASDVFVLPSYAEGMPLSIMEAMAKGLPVIASAVSGIPEELGDAGILIQDPSISPATTGMGLVEAIEEMAAQAARRKELGRRAKQRAEFMFHEHRMVVDYWRMIAAATPSVEVKPHDYISPGMSICRCDDSFPNMIEGNTGESDWPYLRREVAHRWYVDRRYPSVGFLSRDEAHILFNTARFFSGKCALEIGCFLGWSTCHLALGGVSLDVIDPLLQNPQFRLSVESSLKASGVLDHVSLVAGLSPAAVHELAADGRRWSLIFIDGNHEADGPRLDAATVEPFAAEDCIVLFHDLAAPAVANGLRYLRDRGWKIRIYRTMQIMAAAWRGRIEPPEHMPDPAIEWSLPLFLADLDLKEFGEIQGRAAPHTMTSIPRQFALYKAIDFITEREIPGDIIECGVWQGGSMMIAASALMKRGVRDRRLVLYDTFAGMTPPTAQDIEANSGRPAASILSSMPRSLDNFYWALAPLDQVKANLAATGYPAEQIDYVVGDVCQTLPRRQPGQVALLRLDTDWYASTRCELECLYSQLARGGVLIVDDYGHWEGSRRACDEFFAGIGTALHPVPDDDTARWLIKDSEGLSREFMRLLRLA